jgi:Ca2+-binding RTX toxin-like protein
MRTQRSRSNRFVPSLESLESRELMSITSVTVSAGTLTVNCDSANNNVSIFTQPRVVVASKTMTPLVATANGSVWTDTITVKDLTRTTNNYWIVPSASVQKIVVNAGAGNNRIISNVATPTTVNAGDGNNYVVTGAAGDTVFCGNGNNTVITNDGNDVVVCGNGNNYILGGNGDDNLTAGSGNNNIMGGAGNDQIADGFDATRKTTSLLYGEAGNDTIVSINRNDVVDGGTGFDTATVQAGTYIVRNVDNVTINVPLGNPVATDKESAVNAGRRLLQAYGLTPQVGVILNNGQWGLDPAALAAWLHATKPNITLVSGNTGALNIINQIYKGKPVIIPISNGAFHQYVLVNGYDSATRTFTYVDKTGVPSSINIYFNGWWAEAVFGWFQNEQLGSLIY